jgi:hypothetical protein
VPDKRIQTARRTAIHQNGAFAAQKKTIVNANRNAMK